ncbi:6-bladed beta-propeller [Thiolapillus sp.]
MKKRNFSPYAFLAIFFAILVLAGCATAPEPPEEKPEAGPVFYPPLPNPPRIQFLTTFSGAADLEQAEKSELATFVLGKEAKEERELTKPYGVALFDGKLYAADTRGGGYAIFDLRENTFRAVGGLKKPINITFDEKGNKYVTDTILDQVVVYGPGDNRIQAFGETGKMKPGDVAILGNKLFVSDLKNHQIQVLDKTSGEFLYAIGSAGSAEGQLIYPTNLAVGPDGNLYVSDTGNFRVQVFSPEGRFIRKLGEIGTALGKFARPKGISVDREGRIYVVDAAFQNVQVFDSEGKLLMFFAEPGNGPGQLYLPTDISIDYENVAYFQPYAEPGFKLEYVILVSNQFGPNKVNVYGFGKMQGMDYQ